MKENINLVNNKNESIESDYTRTLQFIFIKASLDLFPNSVITIQHSVGKGIFGEIFKEKPLDEKDVDKIKAYSAASDNIGNFFAQNVFMANSGVLLIAGTLESLGYNVDTLAIAKASIPVALIAFVLCLLQNYILDRRLKQKYNKKQ